MINQIEPVPIIYNPVVTMLGDLGACYPEPPSTERKAKRVAVS